MPCSQIQPRIQATAHRKYWTKEVTNCSWDWVKHLSATAPFRHFFQKSKWHFHSKWSCPSCRRDGPVHGKGTPSCDWRYQWLLKGKSLWHMDREAQGFHFVIPGIYLISCRMCLWIIHFYKNNIIPLRSIYFPSDISKKAAVYCVFILKLACFTRDYMRLYWRTM